MIRSNEAPMDNIQVYTTKDYSLFKTLNGNRDVNQIHLSRLKESMRENHLITIIMVNENYEIIDGQHRFLISQEYKLPIYYIICKKYGLNEVQILNANMKNWTIIDYVNGYCDLGYKDYIIYREFVDYYGFQSQVSILLLTNEYMSGSNIENPASRFKQGLFKVKDLDNAKKMAEKIMMIEPYYKGFLRRSFVYALFAMFKNENFEFTEFIAKLKQQPTTMCDCTNTAQYKVLIEEIYNYRRREKVNLRY